MFGEEYTLVACADYVLQYHKKGNTVSNLSSTRALRDVTEKAGGKKENMTCKVSHAVYVMCVLQVQYFFCKYQHQFIPRTIIAIITI